MAQVKTIKKLIEVSLPLDDINIAAAREKSIRHGHPATLHLWWARRPLAAARAVIFSQMVNDPGGNRGYGPGKSKAQVKLERERLFDIMRKLVVWENSNNEAVLNEARSEIWKSWREVCDLNKNHPDAATLFNPDKLPGFHDPFAGGGALPLEAQRLGLDSYATDLNPVAISINKAMIEIPPRFANHRPIGPVPDSDRQGTLSEDWGGAKGLAEEVRRYGLWMREEAFRRIGHLYPKVATKNGEMATAIAWIWVRTVKSPNPAFSHVDVPLATTFVLSRKSGGEHYIEPIIDGETYRFVVRPGQPTKEAVAGTKLARGANFECLISKTPIDDKYIKAESMAGRIGVRLLAVVADTKQGRVYLSPTDEMEAVAKGCAPEWRPEQTMNRNTRDLVSGRGYGFFTWGDLFSPRQLVALTTFSDLVQVARQKALEDAIKAGMADDGISLEAGGAGAQAFADAVSVYLAMAVDKAADYNSSLVAWSPNRDQLKTTFARQALAMVWDYAEANPFANAAGDLAVSVQGIVRSMSGLPAICKGEVSQADAQRQTISAGKVVSTDPPYYDNIAYADLSDFFYVWLRKALRPVYPSLFATMAVPKDEELVASSYRHGSKSNAEKFFLGGMTEAMSSLAKQAHPAFPTTIYYAFKQSDSTELGTGNTGWETFLEAVLRAGFAITGTWPMRTERDSRSIGIGTNALASSIILVCQQRPADAPTAVRRDFLRELKEELSEAVDEMIGGTDAISPVAPVDLAQAVIGPGMAIFSKYAAVLEADGSPMSVHSALTLINRMLIEGGDDFDPDTQFCLAWFDQYGWSVGPFGEANTLAQAKATSAVGVENAGVIESGGGKVRLLKPADYPSDWSPETDNRTPIWEALHQMIRSHRSGGDSSAGTLLARMHERSEPIRQLAYRLYTLCERKGWAEDARAYNELITAWPHIEAASHAAGLVGSQAKLDI